MNIPEKRVIYFPEWGDSKQYHPQVITVDRVSVDPAWYSGNTDIDELHAGRRGHYKVSRCIEYSEASLRVCNEWEERYLALMIEWNKLPATAKKAGAQLPLQF